MNSYQLSAGIEDRTTAAHYQLSAEKSRVKHDSHFDFFGQKR